MGQSAGFQRVQAGRNGRLHVAGWDVVASLHISSSGIMQVYYVRNHATDVKKLRAKSGFFFMAEIV